MQADTPSRAMRREARVDPSWVDLYGHMNMAYYVKLFDDLGHEMLGEIGLGEDYTLTHRLGLFTVEATVRYLREVTADAPLIISMRIDKADRKRLWTSFEMHHAERGYLAATLSQLAVHASLDTRRAADFPAFVRERLDALLAN